MDEFMRKDGQVLPPNQRVQVLLAPSADATTDAGSALAVWLAKVIPDALANINREIQNTPNPLPKRQGDGMFKKAAMDKYAHRAAWEELAKNLTHYSALVIVGKAMTPAAYFTAYPEKALDLWDKYIEVHREIDPASVPPVDSPAETPAAESVKKPQRTTYKPPPPLTKGGRLSEAGELVAQFMEEYRIDTAAGRSYLGVVQYAHAMRPAEFFRQYKRESAELWEYFAHITIKNIQAEMENIRAEIAEAKQP